MDRKERVLKEVFKVKAAMESLLQASEEKLPLSSHRALAYLKQLDTTDVTWEVLEKTKIGYTVNTLRKTCTNVRVKTSGKRLLRKWKELEVVRKEPQSESPENLKQSPMKGGAIRDSQAAVCPLKPAAVVSAVSDHAYSEDGSRWSVRFASAVTGVGLKLIFARKKITSNEKRKENRLANLGVTKREVRLVSR